MQARRGGTWYRLLAAATAGGAVAHLLPGVVAWRSMRCRLLPRLSGVGDAGHVALTFDDGPDPKSTPPILDALDALGWQATFFCLGSQVRRSPRLTRGAGAPGPRGRRPRRQPSQPPAPPLHVDGSRPPPGPRDHRGRGRRHGPVVSAAVRRGVVGDTGGGPASRASSWCYGPRGALTGNRGPPAVPWPRMWLGRSTPAPRCCSTTPTSPRPRALGARRSPLFPYSASSGPRLV